MDSTSLESRLSQELNAALRHGFETWNSPSCNDLQRAARMLYVILEPHWYTGSENAEFLRKHIPHPSYTRTVQGPLCKEFFETAHTLGIILPPQIPFVDNYAVNSEQALNGDEEVRTFLFEAACDDLSIIISLNFYHSHKEFSFTRAPEAQVTRAL